MSEECDHWTPGVRSMLTRSWWLPQLHHQSWTLVIQSTYSHLEYYSVIISGIWFIHIYHLWLNSVVVILDKYQNINNLNNMMLGWRYYCSKALYSLVYISHFVIFMKNWLFFFNISQFFQILSQSCNFFNPKWALEEKLKFLGEIWNIHWFYT